MQGFINFRQNSDLISSSGAITEQGVSKLAQLNYQLVINLLPESSEKAHPNEQLAVEFNNINYCYIPVDFNNPKESEYQQFCEILNTHQQFKTHIHCAYNYRASAFYAMYAFENMQWSKQQALSFINDLWQPKEHVVWWELLQDHGLV